MSPVDFEPKKTSANEAEVLKIKNQMIELSREQHCALAGIDVQAFKTLQRYRRVPQLPVHLRAANGFSPFETLALMVALAFRDQFFQSHAQAAHLGSQLEKILPRWLEICEASESPIKEILFGKVYFPGIKISEAVCGTLLEIGTEYPQPMGFIGLSISRVLAMLRKRATDLGLDLSEFWGPEVSAAIPEVASSKKSRRPKRKSS